MTQRTASCPNCGAEITFRWSGAVQTTCPACKSILVRHDVDLTKVGVAADVPPSMSRIQIGTEGRFKKKPFEVIGRIVYRYGRGHWSEWHIRMSDGESRWLSDAGGEYVVTKRVEKARLPKREDVVGGDPVEIGDKTFTIAALTRASYVSVEGELPFEYWDKSEMDFVDLKQGTDAFATIDYSEDPPLLFLGEYESFEELAMKNLREPDAGAQVTGVKGFNCPLCGAAIELRTGALAVTVACRACGTVVDAQDPNLKMIEGAENYVKGLEFAIPLGAVGVFKGTSWTCVGVQIRCITVEHADYCWREYLLWNVDRGFKYLTEYDGHWNDVTVLRGIPTKVSGDPQPEYEYLSTRFKHFQAAIAVTRTVIGEFPWEARVGDAVASDDFVAPPLMLSKESTEEEITWSLGTYTEPEHIQQAFKLEGEPLQRVGVFANQPNPTLAYAKSLNKVLMVLVLALVLLFIGRRVTATNKQLFVDSFLDDRRGSPPFVTRVFDVPGHTASVEIRLDTQLSANDWAYFNLALLREDGAAGYEVGREVSYYAGIENGESWSEGSRADRVLLASVPPGKYYLRIETERDPNTSRPFTYEISVRRDVPRIWPFLVAFILLVVPPLIFWVIAKHFEQQRWAESDYAPTSSEDSDE